MSGLNILATQVLTDQAIQTLAWSLIHFLWQGLAIALIVGMILWLCHPLVRSLVTSYVWLVYLRWLLARSCCGKMQPDSFWKTRNSRLVTSI